MRGMGRLLNRAPGVTAALVLLVAALVGGWFGQVALGALVGGTAALLVLSLLALRLPR